MLNAVRGAKRPNEKKEDVEVAKKPRGGKAPKAKAKGKAAVVATGENAKDETPKDADQTPKDQTPKDETPKDETPNDEPPSAANPSKKTRVPTDPSILMNAWEEKDRFFQVQIVFKSFGGFSSINSLVGNRFSIKQLRFPLSSVHHKSFCLPPKYLSLNVISLWCGWTNVRSHYFVRVK